MPVFWFCVWSLQHIYTAIQSRKRFLINYIYTHKIRLFSQWIFRLSERYMTAVIICVQIILISAEMLLSSQDIQDSIMWIISFSDCFLLQGHIWRLSMKSMFILAAFRSAYILNVMAYMLLTQKQYAHMMVRMLFLPKERLIKVII